MVILAFYMHFAFLQLNYKINNKFETNTIFAYGFHMFRQKFYKMHSGKTATSMNNCFSFYSYLIILIIFLNTYESSLVREYMTMF